MAKLRLQSGDGEPVTLNVERDGDGCFVIGRDGGKPVRVCAVDGADGLDCLRVGDAVVAYSARVDGDAVEVWIRGRAYRFAKVTRGRGKAHAAAPGLSELVAPMPGVVRSVLVKGWESVAADQPLVVMESMKMEMTLVAPRDAVVAEVSCAEGAMVQMNQPLVRFAPDGDGAA